MRKVKPVQEIAQKKPLWRWRDSAVELVSVVKTCTHSVCAAVEKLGGGDGGRGGDPKNFALFLSAVKTFLRRRRQCVRALRIAVFEGCWWSKRGVAPPPVTPSPKGTPMTLWICMNKLPLASRFGRRSTPRAPGILTRSSRTSPSLSPLLFINTISARCQQIVRLIRF